MNKVLQINVRDNVAVALHKIKKGEIVELSENAIEVQSDINEGHKIALRDIKKGQDIVKYGFIIGYALCDIKRGDHVHTHNIRTKLSSILTYNYHPGLKEDQVLNTTEKFMGYFRKSGRAGIRNEIWIIPTVGCINQSARLIAHAAGERYRNTKNIDGIYEFTHPYGCSQLGDDHLNTQKILSGLINHPNAAGVLVLGLGCENNNICEMKKVLRNWDPDRVKFLEAQKVDDEVETGVQIIGELVEYASQFSREPIAVSELKIGLKCGGSDGFSGITGNPLVGAFSDMIVERGGTTVLTEVPEMFGAETILMNRARNEVVFNKIVALINNFKEYFQKHEQPIYENPSPGNKEGGISTLEEKSLGCTQKGGTSNVVDVVLYGDMLEKKGLNLLQGPGNDMVSTTAMAAAGCQIILFTTGRGTPLGTCVPTVKIATNTLLSAMKPNWIDFDAGQLVDGQGMETLSGEFYHYFLKVISGEVTTKSEDRGFREIAIFKNGVTL